MAKVDFPVVSADYGDAIGSCDRVLGGVDRAMRRPEQFGGGALGPVHQAYLDLHETVTGFLKETKTNLDDTATALGTEAQHYAGTDQSASDELHRRATRPGPGRQAVTFAQLMQHARDIKDKAAELAIKEHDQRYATQSGLIRDPEPFKQH